MLEKREADKVQAAIKMIKEGNYVEAALLVQHIHGKELDKAMLKWMIADHLIQAGQPKQATPLLREAMATGLKGFFMSEERATLLGYVALALSKAGQEQLAAEAFGHSIRIANSCWAEISKIHSWAVIASSLAKSGRKAQADALFKKAVDLAESLYPGKSDAISDEFRVRAWSFVGARLVDAGYQEKGSQCLDRSMRITRSMVVKTNDDHRYKMEALLNIAANYADVQLIDQALDAARAISGPQSDPASYDGIRSDMLTEIASKLVEMERVVTARKIFDEAVSTAIGNEMDPQIYADRLLRIAQAYIDSGWEEDAMRLITTYKLGEV